MFCLQTAARTGPERRDSFPADTVTAETVLDYYCLQIDCSAKRPEFQVPRLGAQGVRKTQTVTPDV